MKKRKNASVLIYWLSFNLINFWRYDDFKQKYHGFTVSVMTEKMCVLLLNLD